MPCATCGRVHGAGESCTVAYLSLDAATLAVADDDKRELEGLAIPYGVELQRLDWLTGATRWIFAEGSVKPTEDAKLFYGHDHLGNGLPVGKIVGHEQTPAGLRIRTRISKTPKGDEVYQLCKDGVLDRFSVGLDRMAAKTHVDDPESGDALLTWEDVPAWEVSVVPKAAYHDQAKIDAVLSANNHQKGNTMPCTKCGKIHATGVTECQTGGGVLLADAGAQLQQLAESQTVLSASLDQLERRIATIGDLGGGGAGSSRSFALEAESYGEWLQAVAREDQNALDFLAFVGQTTGDLGEWIEGTWVGELQTRLTERRRILNLFKTRPLPAQGMNVDHGRVEVDDSGVNVGEQLAEGDLLPYGKLAFNPGLSAPVRTFGGWGDMSRQVIERSGVAVVEEFFNALVNRYLQVTEAAARVVAINPANAVVSQSTAASDLTTLDGWLDFTLDASFALDDAGLPLDFILASRTRFKQLAHMRTGAAADAPYALDRNTGKISVTGLTGEMFTVPVIPLNVAGDYVRAGSGEAITTWEAPGAPWRLQDDDITNLTKAFSIYGYAAFASTNANALIRPTEAGDVTP